MRGFPLLAAAVMVLTAGACATPPAEKSSTGGRAGASAEAGSGEGEKGKAKKPWWRLSQYSRPGKRPVWPGDMPPGRPGLISGKDGEFVLFRKGEEAGGSSDSGSDKPTKVRR